MTSETREQRGRILLVEDDDLSRWAVRTYLEKQEYPITDASGGGEARKRFAEGCFDLLIADLHLTDVNGLDLAAEFRRACPAGQVVIVTGQGSKESVLNALRHGVFDYLEKPFPMELLGIVVGKAMDKIRTERELVRLSRTDGLTGLFNQRYFYEVLGREISRARRQGRRLSLILTDLDNFKEYNDRHGHLAGDEILVKVAGCLREACRREVDLAFRYGGDEFILILPEADMATARQVSERIRSMVSALGLDRITLSVGLAELEEQQDLTTFIRHADEAMYLAKQMGGDRAIVFASRG